MKENLRILALDIFQNDKDNKIDFEFEYERTDYLSKIVDYDDWTDNIAIFLLFPLFGAQCSRLFC